jgi:hypothetical protein
MSSPAIEQEFEEPIRGTNRAGRNEPLGLIDNDDLVVSDTIPPWTF